MARVVETDNYDGDYPDEKFLAIPPMAQVDAKRVADAINSAFPTHSPRYWKVVPDDYELRPGLEP